MEIKERKYDMLVSVIVTAFNRKNYILDALTSVVKLYVPPDIGLEIVVVKNFSDPSVDHFIAENRIIEVRAGNTPIGDYVILGLTASHGDWILILNDDDLFTNDKLSNLYNYLKDENVGVIHNRQEFINDKLESIVPPAWNRRNYTILIFSHFNRRSVRKFYRFHLWHNDSSYCIRREILYKFADKISLFNMIDNIFPVISVVDGKKFIAIPDRLTILRQSKDSYHIKSTSHAGRLSNYLRG